MEINNPFAVQTPEELSAQDVVNLFVEDFSDFYKIPKAGHTFLNGARGSGKSMIFRYLEPDVQCLTLNKSVSELPFFAAYVSIKNTDLKLTEFIRLENKHANIILNEHFVTVYIAIKLLVSILKAPTERDISAFNEVLTAFYAIDFAGLMKKGGWRNDLPEMSSSPDLDEYINKMIDVLDSVYSDTISYLRKLSFDDEVIHYSGPLYGYLDFLVPLIKKIKMLPFMPNGSIYLLIDDADNLSKIQTSILNTWVSHRTIGDVSLKISTQLAYKTWRTITGQRIDSPHDYSDVNIYDIYTSSKNKYKERLTKIVKKRLENYGLKDVEPEGFFPPDQDQEAAIKAISDEIRTSWETDGRGYRPSDDVVRYARPTYIARLKEGKSKSGSTYSYSGFDQLLHISSGVVRYFLEPASLMYAEQISRNPQDKVAFIEPSIQNKVIRQQANDFLFAEFDKILKDEVDEKQPHDKPRKLRNLIMGLGGVFHYILLSNLSERRVFSIAFSNEPDSEVLEIINLGIQYGYFHRSSIGNKDGYGRTSLYILSRRLAPFFNLDPTSFAGYKFVTNDVIREVMYRPQSFLRRMEKRPIDAYLDDPQRSLFDEVQ